MKRDPSIPLPTAGEVTRRAGRYAVCTIAGLVLTAHEWELEIRTDFVDGTGHGDIWDIPVPLKYSWTARVRGRFDTANNPYMHLYNGQITGSPPPDITAIAFNAYGSTTIASPVFTGNGFVVRASWQAPNDAMLEQEVEMRGTGTPSAIT